MKRLFSKICQSIAAWWLALSDRERIHVHVLTLLSIGYVLHYLVFSAYFIEDAGISYSFARNLVEGEGLVAYPGGERVEGYSNPTWTFLIAFFYALKVPVWFSAKALGAVFGALTLPLAYLLVRECRPGKEDGIALLAPFFLAASTTFVVWNASGLENSLFNILLAGGMLCVLREGRDSSARPLSAVCFVLLAMTRPEGILYAAIAGFFRLIMALRQGPVIRPILAWLAVFWVPFCIYHAWRFSYFGWEWPNTYYAKLDGENRFKPFKWNVRGWLYVRNHLRAYFLGFALPLYAIALVGLKDARRWLVLGLTSLGAVVFFWNGRLRWPKEWKSERLAQPDWWPALETAFSPIHHEWDKVRVGFLVLSILLLVLASRWTRGGFARVFILVVGLCSVFFILVSGGDWMKQWRWFSLTAVPNFILLAVGVGALVEALPVSPGRRSMIGAWVVAVVLALPNLWNTIHAAPTPETTVSDVRRRVTYMQGVEQKLHLDEVTLLDVDMGAHMWFSGWDIVDIAGLVDVPMARHLFQRDFLAEYVFEERRPDFAHVHGGWANKSKIPRLPIWKKDYIEIPGYPTGRKSFHVGNHVRKSLFVHDRFEGTPGRRVEFEKEVVLEGFEIPATEVGQGQVLYLETWLSGDLRTKDFRLLVFVDDGQGHMHSAALPPGYDWYAPKKWKKGETVWGRWDISLPEGLPVGEYGVGFLLMDTKKGKVLGPLSTGQESDANRMARGEVFFEGVFRVVAPQEAIQAASEALAGLRVSAAKGDCEEAASLWKKARHHASEEGDFMSEHFPEVRSELARCYVLLAEQAPAQEDQIAYLLAAREQDHRESKLLSVSRPLAKTLDAQGDDFWKAGDMDAAYASFRDALRLDPRLSKTRRKAEEVRDVRLGIESKQRDSAKRASSPKPAEKASAKKSPKQVGGAPPPKVVSPSLEVDDSPQADPDPSGKTGSNN